MFQFCPKHILNTQVTFKKRKTDLKNEIEWNIKYLFPTDSS